MTDQQKIIEEISQTSMFGSPISSQLPTASSTPQDIESMAIVDENKQCSFTFNKENLRCQKEDHEQARLKFLCIDSNCEQESRLACAECILNNHKDHKYIVLEKFAGDLSQKFEKINQHAKYIEQESKTEEFLMTLSQQIKDEFEDIKQQVIKSLEEFEKDYLIQIEKQFQSEKLLSEQNQAFQSIVQLSTSPFESMDSQAIAKLIEFFQEDRLEKEIDENKKVLIKSKAAMSKKKTKYFEKFRQLIKNILINCKNAPQKDNASTPCSPILVPAGTVMNEEKKKRKIIFNDDNNVVYEAAPIINQPKAINILDLQSFSARSFAGEARRFSNSVHKKMKVDPQAASQFSQQQSLLQPISTQ